MRVEAFVTDTDWRRVATLAQSVEEVGFDGLCTPEIIGDPFMPLVAAALSTERLALRTAIAVAFPRSPMVVAGTSWALQANSRGRFTLGLGTQVKGHNERRFSVPWTAPASRLREYVASLRAIWRCWEKREKLEFLGEHYRFTLMTPEFSPEPSGLPRVPVYLAAVRPRMLSLAGSVADGVRLHGFCTRRYLDEVVLPRLRDGLGEAGRDRKTFEVCGGGFIATGAEAAAVSAALEWVRSRVAFYASTRTYRPVMELHGWDTLATRLYRMSVTGRWGEMASQVPDEVLAEFVAAAPYADLPAAVEKRFGGLVDTVALGVDGTSADPALREVVQDLHRIPSGFESQPSGWD